MALAISTVADSISKLSVTGLTIKDINEIPAGTDSRGKTLIPKPNFMTDFSMERDSFGGGSTAKMTVNYTLNYRMLYKPVGAGRQNVLEYYDDLTSMIGLVLDAVLAIDTLTGTVDIVPLSVTNMGLVNDPADQAWYGCDFAFRVMEFVN